MSLYSANIEMSAAHLLLCCSVARRFRPWVWYSWLVLLVISKLAGVIRAACWWQWNCPCTEDWFRPSAAVKCSLVDQCSSVEFVNPFVHSLIMQEAMSKCGAFWFVPSLVFPRHSGLRYAQITSTRLHVLVLSILVYTLWLATCATHSDKTICDLIHFSTACCAWTRAVEIGFKKT